jgi:trk system potassium uptake protein TrkH
MRISICVYYIGLILALIGAGVILSGAIGLFYHDGSVDVLFIAGLLIVGMGIFPLIFVPYLKDISLKEAIFIVVGSWLTICTAGALPFYLFGQPFTIVNALFESFSGFTTTGASILTDVESLPKGLVFWRSLTHWLGGSGVVVLAIAILPALSGASSNLMRQEYSNILARMVLPRARTISQVIVLVYIGLTVAETLALLFAGLDLFNASTTAFASIATGGFSVRNASIAAYESVYVELIVIIFMVVSGINFAFIYGVLIGRKLKIPGWETVRVYLVYLAIATLIITVSIHSTIYQNWGTALRHAAFQVATIASTTGFASADSSVWTAPAHFVLIVLLLIGATSGSTCGAIKVDRIVLLWKLIKSKIRRLIHPGLVDAVRVDGLPLKFELAQDAMLFIVSYLSIVGMSTLALTTFSMPLLESFTGTIACMGGVGPGLGTVGSMGNYAAIPQAAKLLLCLVMLIGRLEIFILFLPFTRGYWRA